MTVNHSMWSQVGRNFLLRFRSRYLEDYEWTSRCLNEDSTIQVELSGVRRLLAIELYMRSAETCSVESVTCVTENAASVTPAIETSEDTKDDIRLFLIMPLEKVEAQTINIILKNYPAAFDYKVHIKVVDKQHDDLDLLRNAVENLEAGDPQQVVYDMADYRALNDHNPHAYFMLARACLALKKYDQAREATLQALSGNLVDDCSPIFRIARDAEPEPDIEHLRHLQRKHDDWQLPGNIGLVTLEKTQRYAIGYGDCFAYSTKATVLVRRPAAGRLLRSLSFPFSPRRDILLHTRLQVVHRDDAVEVVPMEKFRITDASDKNLFITVEDEKEGHWILPDLERGDIIVWSYDLFSKCQATGSGSQFYKLAYPFDSLHPTCKGTVEFVVPSRVTFDTSKINWSSHFSVSKTNDDSRRVIVLGGERFLPVKHTGFPFEENYLNPLVAAASGGRTWKEVADLIMTKTFGGLDPDDELPPELSRLLEDTKDKAAALEDAFYWIRDKLKYASLQSAQEQIGTKDRAVRIVDSGNADCKDRAYLMKLVCSALGFKYQYVMVSSRSGLIVEELPADQFDHVFIRVETRDRWIYLDPTDSEAAFDCTPFWCQGLKALMLDGEGSIETIPEDSVDRNALEIHESVETITDGWLEGSFDIVARGHIGRSLNEMFKSLSLAMDDPQHAATECLRRYLPASVVTSFERISDTGSSSVFHVTGAMRRCRLMTMRQGERVASLAWVMPFLPVSYWRVLNLERLFVFNFPCKVRLAVTFGPRIKPLVRDFSKAKEYKCEIGEVQERTESRDSLLTIVRSIQIRQRFVTDDLTRQVPPLLDAIEGALRLAVSLAPGTGDDSEGG